MIDGAGPFRILRSVILPLSIPAHHGGHPVPLLLLVERLLRAAAVPVRQARAADRCRSRSSSTTRCTSSQPTLIQAVGPDDDGGARWSCSSSPSGRSCAASSSPGSRSERRRGGRPDTARVADHPVGRVAARDRPAVRGRRPPAGPCPDDRRRRVRRYPDRRAGHGQHRADVPWRRRALAPRGRHAPPRTRRGRRRSRSSWEARPGRPATVLSALRPRTSAELGLDAARGWRHVPRASSRGPGRPSNRTSSGSASSASSSARSSPAISSASALPVGVFEWWVENPGPDPLTVGLCSPGRTRSRSDRARRGATCTSRSDATDVAGRSTSPTPPMPRRACVARWRSRRPAEPRA